MIDRLSHRGPNGATEDMQREKGVYRAQSGSITSQCQTNSSYLTRAYLTTIKCRVPMGLVNPNATLPVDLILPDVIRSLERNPNLVIEAPPGAGKTTRVPPALLKHLQGEIVVLEPRRIAARLAARRVAFEMSEPVGQTIGYQVRFEGIGGPHTRLRYVTEGVLTRRLMSNPDLRGVDAVVLDEFHERHLDSDLALALLKRDRKSTRLN